ncbi:MAG: hypothetical protein NVS4B5_09070 [Vulcanimicrobiaceae bacterium]
MVYRILVTDDIDPEGVAVLAAEPSFNVDELPTMSKDELLQRVGVYDALVGRSATRISEELLRRAERLRVIGRAGVGIDNIALDVATALGVAVINAPAGNTVAVAELFFGSVIGLLRHIPKAAEAMAAGRWDRSRFLGAELKGKTLGIVGIGRIGGEIAQRAHAFGMGVIGYDPYIADDRFRALRVDRLDSLDDLAARADVLTVHTPLTDETRNLVTARVLGRMPAGGIVVNLARGGIIDESALVDALCDRHIRGAVVDVYVTEPLATDHPLRKLPNVLLTPHIGASCSPPRPRAVRTRSRIGAARSASS